MTVGAGEVARGVGEFQGDDKLVGGVARRLKVRMLDAVVFPSGRSERRLESYVRTGSPLMQT